MKIGITIFCGSTIICHVAISTKRRALSRETTKKTKKKNRQINKQTYPVSLSATRKTFISVPLCHTNELVDSSLNFQKKKKWNRAMFVTCLPSTSRPVHHFFLMMHNLPEIYFVLDIILFSLRKLISLCDCICSIPDINEGYRECHEQDMWESMKF